MRSMNFLSNCCHNNTKDSFHTCPAQYRAGLFYLKVREDRQEGIINGRKRKTETDERYSWKA